MPRVDDRCYVGGYRTAGRDQRGFTMIELLIVMVICFILVLVALPSYLKFRVRANDAAAKTNLHDAVPGLVQWNGDHKTGYAGVTITQLRIDYRYKLKDVSIFWPVKSTYCLKSKVGTSVWYKGGPSGAFTQTKPASICP